jgi:hypothetical protein
MASNSGLTEDMKASTSGTCTSVSDKPAMKRLPRLAADCDISVDDIDLFALEQDGTRVDMQQLLLNIQYAFCIKYGPK